MSTRSRIAIEDNETGKIRSIYCHFDGYPSHNGQILVDHYRTSAQVEELIELGSLSVLAPNPKPTDPGHAFGSAQPDVVVAYHRDRGESLEIEEDTNAVELYERAAGGWEEYVYLFRQGVWFVTEVGGGAGPFLVNANDPEGSSPANWMRVEAALSVDDAGMSYAIV